MVCQTAVIHHLKQDVEDIRMRFLDLVEQKHTVRVLIHAVGQKTALIKADVARRRADQARNRVLFHVLRHVKAQKFNSERIGKLFCHFGFTHTGWTGEQVVPDGFLRLAQTCTAKFDGRRQGLDCLVLTKDDTLQSGLEILQYRRIVL